MALPNVTNLRVTSGSSRPVVLEWDGIDQVTYGECTYSVFRKRVQDVSWPARIGWTANTTYTDSTAAAGTSYEYRVAHSYGLAAEPCMITALGVDPTFGPYIDVERAEGSSITNLNVHSHPAGTPFSVDHGSSWIRPFGALDGERNGTGSPDVGIANGFKDRSLEWAWEGKTPEHGKHRGGYFGHSDYIALYSPQWPPEGSAYDSASQTLGRVFYDTYDGEEFWLQWRMKIDSSRFTPTPTVPASAGKLFYLQTCNGSSACQLYFNLKPSTRGRVMQIEHDGQSAIGSRVVPLYDNGAPFECPVDEWWTYMIHIKPSRTNTAADTNTDGTLELFAQAPGDTSWRTLYSNTAFPFHYSFPPDWAGSEASTTNPPGWNSFSARQYPNHYVSSSSSGATTATNAAHYTQIIFSSQPIPLPLFPA